MQPSKRYTAVGVFHERRQAENAVQELTRAGFPHNQIGMVARTGPGTERPEDTEEVGTMVGEGAAAGAVTGGCIGTLTGLAVAAGMVPAVGPIVAGGMLIGILAGAAVGAAAGGLLGALIGLGIPEEEAAYYESEFHAGRVIVTVKTNGRYSEALTILRRCGAYDISTQGSLVGAGAAEPEGR
jgi:hypothetical protein